MPGERPLCPLTTRKIDRLQLSMNARKSEKSKTELLQQRVKDVSYDFLQRCGQSVFMISKRNKGRKRAHSLRRVVFNESAETNFNKLWSKTRRNNFYQPRNVCERSYKKRSGVKNRVQNRRVCKNMCNGTNPNKKEGEKRNWSTNIKLNMLINGKFPQCKFCLVNEPIELVGKTQSQCNEKYYQAAELCCETPFWVVPKNASNTTRIYHAEPMVDIYEMEQTEEEKKYEDEVMRDLYEQRGWTDVYERNPKPKVNTGIQSSHPKKVQTLITQWITVTVKPQGEKKMRSECTAYSEVSMVSDGKVVDGPSQWNKPRHDQQEHTQDAQDNNKKYLLENEEPAPTSHAFTMALNEEAHNTSEEGEYPVSGSHEPMTLRQEALPRTSKVDSAGSGSQQHLTRTQEDTLMNNVDQGNPQCAAHDEQQDLMEEESTPTSHAFSMALRQETLTRTTEVDSAGSECHQRVTQMQYTLMKNMDQGNPQCAAHHEQQDLVEDQKAHRESISYGITQLVCTRSRSSILSLKKWPKRKRRVFREDDRVPYVVYYNV